MGRTGSAGTASRRGWRERVLVAAAVVAAVGPAVLSVVPLAATAAGGSAEELEAAFTSRVGAERLAQGRTALVVEADLVEVARRHAAAMSSQGRLYHNTLLGQQVQGWQLVGENVGTGVDVDDVHRALMASETHRGEILNPRFDGIGVGVSQSGSSLWVTQVFRQRAGTLLPPPPPPPPPPPHAPAPRVLAATAPGSPVAAPALAASRRAVPTTMVSTTTGVSLATAPPPAPASPAPPGVELAAQPVVASLPLPTRPAVADAGLLAAALLWMVVAGMTRVSLGSHRTPSPR